MTTIVYLQCRVHQNVSLIVAVRLHGNAEGGVVGGWPFAAHERAASARSSLDLIEIPAACSENEGGQITFIFVVIKVV